MQRFTLRGGAVLLALLSAAACGETPTASNAPRTPVPVHFTVTPATGLSVTNSGGYPLIGWTAPAGATSFTIRLISYNTVNGAYTRRFFSTLGTTTGTSYLDTANAYTGSYMKCDDEGPDGNIYGGWWEYEVVSNFPDGTSSARIYAPIGEC
jgi:hypothetical protein